MITWNKELYHYGMPRRSGRYKRGSGEDPFHHGSDKPSRRTKRLTKALNAQNRDIASLKKHGLDSSGLEAVRKKTEGKIAASKEKDAQKQIKRNLKTEQKDLRKEFNEASAKAKRKELELEVRGIDSAIAKKHADSALLSAKDKAYNRQKTVDLYKLGTEQKAQKAGAKVEKKMLKKGADPELAKKVGKARVDKYLKNANWAYDFEASQALGWGNKAHRYVDSYGKMSITDHDYDRLIKSATAATNADKAYKSANKAAKESAKRNRRR